MTANSPKTTPTRLIIVCCHSIWLGGPTNGHDEAEWAVEPFQRGEVPTFIEHIKVGLRTLSEQPDSLLVLAGGPTKQERTERCEGESYLALATANAYFSLPISPNSVIHEHYSTDSYQNLLFSLLLFRTLTTAYPMHITLISHEFKRDRFLDLHVRALRWPSNAVTYIGLDPPESVTSRKELEEGERVRGYGPWKEDLYGVGKLLAGKRLSRGWKVERVEEILENFEGKEREMIRGLLEWKGGKDEKEVYPEQLPWGHITMG
ncbi:MAG: hypothetical protein L6R42_010206 [Xanthoria sp. 1 TBL-2021]|nr:MAG: hypothetical protein L6R42_010206 [Xanthoria sp. 1 TBL-2021]